MIEPDEHNIKSVYSDHLDLALKSMRPDKAHESAAHATRQYLASHDFVDVSGKGGAPQYRMVRKREEGKSIR